MPAQRLTMRRIRKLLRLHDGAGASARAIARELGVSRSTVKEYLARAAAAELAWPLPAELTDAVLEERLFVAGGPKPGTRRRLEPDWAALAHEMKRPGVNLTVLWEEYGAAHPGGYSYSRFCELYRDFERQSPTMRQHHVAGDKVFVDYSGKTVPIVDRATGEIRPAQIFVAVLGASNYTPAFAGAGSMPRRAGPRRCPTGSAHMSACSLFSGAAPGSWCPTISNRASTSRHSTTRRSTAATRGWRRITRLASCRHDRANRATRPKACPREGGG
jgi:transposase